MKKQYQNSAWLYKEHHIKGKTLVCIAKEQKVSKSLISLYMQKLSIPVQKKFWGNKNANWKGGKRMDKCGYIYLYVPDHPYKAANNVVFEHRLVMEKYLGRYLKPNEFIHHKNGDRKDNKIENLQIITASEHARYHFKELAKIRKRDVNGRFISDAH